MSAGISRELIALRVARELRPGQTVNLGIGLPTLVAQFVEVGSGIVLHGENGLLGYRPAPGSAEDFDPDFINAGGEPIALVPGSCFFDSALSFAIVRGGHLDVAVLGGLQVSERGDLANWCVPERGGGSIGGAMDIATGARRLIVAMEHQTRDGQPRIVRECDYPLTASSCVDLIVTDLAVIEVTGRGLLLTEVAPGVTVSEVIQATGAPLAVSRQVKGMDL
ncbi:MAG: 3-oxoacid CoA-transferase subunit B [Chloroflexi bacterium]|nr:3-oxoacid CoA-transferase subunit B [Chloroflexota bacterium]